MSQNQNSKQDKERLHNLSKLCLREESRLVKMGILWRMLHERGYCEIHARNYIYFIHPRQIDIKNERTGEIETIYRKSILGNQLKGIEKGFQDYAYKGSREDIEIHKEVGQLVVMGFDLRKMY